MNPEVNFYFTKAKKWPIELAILREVILEFPLNETLKWGVPCYTIASAILKNKPNNILLIHTFKDYFAVLFIKGALLKDPEKILVQQTENVQAARQIRFSNEQEVKNLIPTLKAFISEAISLEEAGIQVPKKKTSEYKIPDEFRKALDKDKKLLTAFKSLTPGRQRAYLLYFAAAKQAKTRVSRIDQYKEKILTGKGLND
jgi:uncharacterized protein YdeI (YjbR/CyaY-like superfamily)